MEESSKKEKIKAAIAICIVLIIIIFSVIVAIIYQIEGEPNMPFKISKLRVISTAEGIENNIDGDEKWNFNILQSNDIYIDFQKNEEYENTEVIKNIIIQNIKITKLPEVGEIKIYMPNSTDGRTFVYSDDFEVKDKLEYKGAEKSNTKALQIGNQGGSIAIRIANTNLAQYTSNEEEVKHDGTLIAKAGIKNEQLKFDVEMDVIIKTSLRDYSTTIKLNLPIDNILENGMCSIEKNDSKEFVFKRTKIN